MHRKGSRFVDVMENVHPRNPTVQVITRRYIEVGIRDCPEFS